MRKKYPLILTLLVLSLSSEIEAQQGGYRNNDTERVSINDTAGVRPVLFRESLFEKEMNDRLAVSVYDLLEGRVAGFGIYKRGNDPNGQYTFRMRGLSSLQNNAPMIVVDGTPIYEINLIDPNDVASVRVLKSTEAFARHGYRASAGVIEIRTKSLAPQSISEELPVQVEFFNDFALSARSTVVPSLHREEFLAGDGNDLGGDTDWQSLISRKPISQLSHVSVSGGNSSTTYRVSGNLRNVEGILKNSGFDRINGRAGIIHRALDERLTLSMGVSATKQSTNYSFQEAFEYAAIFNPTAPVRFASGDFYQPIQFNNYNPMSILELNINDGKARDLNYWAKADYNLSDKFSIQADFAQEFSSKAYGEFYSSKSFFRGFNSGGLARRTFTDRNSTYLSANFDYGGSLGEETPFEIHGGYRYQEHFYESLTLQMGNLPTNDLGYYAIDLSADRVLGSLNNFSGSGLYINNIATPEETIVGFFGGFDISNKDKVWFSFDLTREGASKLGSNSKWGMFPNITVGTDVLKFWNTDWFSSFNLEYSWGKAGTLPEESGLSLARYRYDYSGGGTVNQVWYANPDLKWEEINERSLALDIGIMDNRLTANLEFYRKEIDDFIQEMPAITPLTGSMYQNIGAMETKGWELTLDYLIRQSTDFQWDTRLVLSSYNTTLTEYQFDERMIGSAGWPCGCGTQILKLAVGEEIGQLWGPVFSGEIIGGFQILKDLNRDGILKVDPGSALDEDADFKTLGNANPDLELGWSHHLNFKRWSFDAYIRGAFGHSLINLYRLAFENYVLIGSYNPVITDKAPDGIIYQQYSSLYVERADFVKLQSLSLTYDFNVDRISAIGKLSAVLSVNNLFTITNYTGQDPEPALNFRGAVTNGARIGPADPLVMGMENRYEYLPARSLIMGVRMSF